MLDKNTTQKTQFRRQFIFSVLKVFEPSALGFIVYLLIFVATVVISQPSGYKTNLQQFHFSDLNGTFLHGIYKVYENVISSQITNAISIYVFWLIVAALVYVIASRFTRNFTELTEDFALRHYLYPKGGDRNSALKESIEKLVFRILVAISFLIYLYKSVPVLVRTWNSNNLALGMNLHSIKEILILLIIELVMLHVAVIFIRLFLIKQRVVKVI